MTTREGTWGADLDLAARHMIEATNVEDNEAFLAAFAEDAVVDDFGRRFEGRISVSQRPLPTLNIPAHD